MMNSVAEEQKRNRSPIKKRHPAPQCPECRSDDTQVTHTEARVRRFICMTCEHRWKKFR